MFKRVNSDVVPFSINSPAGNRYAFGTTDVSNDIDVNYNENIKKGFGTGPNEFPELEDFNALMFTGSYLAAYLYQAGIPEWNDKQKYYINSIAMGSDGNLYKSLTGTEETPNVNNNPTLAGSVSWKSIFDAFVKLTGNQTIAGVKTFTSSPMVPAPTTDFQVATKKYVDDNSNSLEYNNGLGKQGYIHTANATFTGADNKIVMTGIVTALGLEVGDVITFNNADVANNKPHTVESITDNNTIIVNYEHCGTRGNGSLKLVNQTVTNANCKLLAKWFVASNTLGRNPILISLTNRVNGVGYQNNTGRDMEIIVEAGSTPGGVLISKDGITYTQIIYSGNINQWNNMTFTVPSGFFYKAYRYEGAAESAKLWVEYR